MRFEWGRSVVTALALVVVAVGIVAPARPAGTGATPATGDRDRRATVLLGTVGDPLPIARPEEQQEGQAFGERVVASWSTPERPDPTWILEAGAPPAGTRIESRIALAPRGPPPAPVAQLVNP